MGARVACGRTRGVKARERRVWTPYRERCGLGGARWLRSWARVLTLGSPYMWRAPLARGGISVWRQALIMSGELFVREVLTACSRTRIVQVSLLVDATAGVLSDYWIVGARGWRERIRWELISDD